MAMKGGTKVRLKGTQRCGQERESKNPRRRNRIKNGRAWCSCLLCWFALACRTHHLHEVLPGTCAMRESRQTGRRGHSFGVSFCSKRETSSRPHWHVARTAFPGRIAEESRLARRGGGSPPPPSARHLKRARTVAAAHCTHVRTLFLRPLPLPFREGRVPRTGHSDEIPARPRAQPAATTKRGNKTGGCVGDALWWEGGRAGLRRGRGWGLLVAYGVPRHAPGPQRCFPARGALRSSCRARAGGPASRWLHFRAGRGKPPSRPPCGPRGARRQIHRR